MLTRKAGEALVITTGNGDEIKVVVIENKGIQVRMGVIANQSVTIDREEIHLRKKAEKRRA